jgi:hypothetical protein
MGSHRHVNPELDEFETEDGGTVLRRDIRVEVFDEAKQEWAAITAAGLSG